MYTFGPVELEVGVSASRLWAGMKDLQVLLPKVLPIMRATVDMEGDGGAGSVRVIRFPQDVSSKVFSMERIDVMDEDTYTEIHTLIGGETDRHYSFYRSTRTFTSVDDNTTVASWFVEYEPLDEHVPPESSKSMFVAVTKAIESYLLSHDDYA